MTGKPIMAKATAVWLIDNTTISFKQIADFVSLHELEVQGIADDDVATGIKGFDPIANNQLTQEEIEKAEADPLHRLSLKYNPAAEGEQRRRGPKYTPLSKRQERPAAILWLVKFHPELSDGQISKLVGTTKPTIQSLRDRTHWNISNITPVDPVALGMCRQSELDLAIEKAARKTANQAGSGSGAEDKLLSTEQSLASSENSKMPSNISGLENFTLTHNSNSENKSPKTTDADSFFNLPSENKPS